MASIALAQEEKWGASRPGVVAGGGQRDEGHAGRRVILRDGLRDED